MKIGLNFLKLSYGSFFKVLLNHNLVVLQGKKKGSWFSFNYTSARGLGIFFPQIKQNVVDLQLDERVGNHKIV